MATNILKRDDLSASREWFVEACRLSRKHSELAARSEQQYGDHGPLIAGVVRDHFPETVKNHLRALALGVTDASDNAYSCKPRRVRMTTMRKLSRAVAAANGSGFYGPQA